MEVQSIKQRFGIIGNSPLLNRAIDVAIQVAPTDLTVLITGESGTGKEVFPKIIHQAGSRKHGHYIAVNCGAIPEGTIDSELFGHEKGSFTGAHEARKGYFEVADGGTIFLDEVAELPLSTQVRLLRVLETGEFFKVGSSKVIKTNVRVVAATNVNVPKAIENGKFRQDLYYRLNTIPIYIPPLRERKDDIHIIFRKFATDFCGKIQNTSLQLTDDAIITLKTFYWPGNVRQLKNVTEQISIIEPNKDIDSATLKVPSGSNSNELPVIYRKEEENFSEREILYKVLFDMKKDMTELKKIVVDLLEKNETPEQMEETKALLVKDFDNDFVMPKPDVSSAPTVSITSPEEFQNDDFDHSEIIEESLSLQDKEREMIKMALERHRGKRKDAAKELGISEEPFTEKLKNTTSSNMTGMKKYCAFFVIMSLITLSLTPSCGIYSFTGASIPPEAKTVSVQYFQNRSSLVEPTLSPTFTEIIRDMFMSQTNLEMVERNGDLAIEGEITNYTIKPVAIQADQTAGQNRLEITVNARFTNRFEPDKDYEQKFTQFRDYSPTANFNLIKTELIDEICTDIAQDIFDKAVINW